MKQLLFIIILALLSISCYAQHGYVRDAMYDKYGKDHEQKGVDWMKSAMNAKVEPQYDFPVMMRMHVTDHKKQGDKKEMDITYYFNPDVNRLAMRPSEEEKRRKKDDKMLFIYDYKANSMIMLNETEKTGMAMNLNAFMSGDAIKRREEGKTGNKGDGTSCKRTGKTKSIHGYLCEQYVCVNEEEHTKTEVWVTNKLPFDISKTASRGPMAGYFGRTSGLGGMTMLAEFYRNDELEVSMEVTDVNPKENLVVKTGEYKFAMRD